MTPIGVGVGVVIRQWRRAPGEDETSVHVLLGKRKGKHGAGEWSLPGGGVDDGESPVSAAYREAMEETGLDLHGIMRIQSWAYDAWPEFDRHDITVFFTGMVPVEAEAENREPDKCEGWEWFPIDALPSPMFAGAATAITTLYPTARRA